MKELPLKVKKNVSLAKYTTFQIGGPALYFIVAKTKKALIKAVLWAKKENLPFFILGGGSNLLVADEVRTTGEQFSVFFITESINLWEISLS